MNKSCKVAKKPAFEGFIHGVVLCFSGMVCVLVCECTTGHHPACPESSQTRGQELQVVAPRYGQARQPRP